MNQNKKNSFDSKIVPMLFKTLTIFVAFTLTIISGLLAKSNFTQEESLELAQQVSKHIISTSENISILTLKFESLSGDLRLLKKDVVAIKNEQIKIRKQNKEYQNTTTKRIGSIENSQRQIKKSVAAMCETLEGVGFNKCGNY